MNYKLTKIRISVIGCKREVKVKALPKGYRQPFYYRTKPHLDIESIIGLLINKDFYSRNQWCAENLKHKLQLLFTEDEDIVENGFRVERELRARGMQDYVENSKTIDLDLYEQYTKLKSSKSKLKVSNLMTGYGPNDNLISVEIFQPAVVMFLHTETGKRLFLQIEGISYYQETDRMCLGSGTRFIKDNNITLPFLKYQQSIIEAYPELKKDYVINPKHLLFKVIKIGAEWTSKEKRTKLVTTLSKHHESLVYNISQYSNFNYTELDFLNAQKECLLKGNSKISLHSPIRIGYSEELAYKYHNRIYPSILDLSKCTGMCHHKIVYRINSNQYESWILLSSVDFRLINGKELTSMDREQIKKRRMHPLLIKILKVIRLIKRYFIRIGSTVFVFFMIGSLYADQSWAMQLPPMPPNNVVLVCYTTPLRVVNVPAQLLPVRQKDTLVAASLNFGSTVSVSPLQLPKKVLARPRLGSFENSAGIMYSPFNLYPDLPHIWANPIDGQDWINPSIARTASINGPGLIWVNEVKKEAIKNEKDPICIASRLEEQKVKQQAVDDHNALNPTKKKVDFLMSPQEVSLRALCYRNFGPEIDQLAFEGPGIYIMIHIKSLLIYVGSSTTNIQVRLAQHWAGLQAGTDENHIMQGTYILYNSSPKDYLCFVLKSHIPITETMSEAAKAFAIENNKYPENWENIIRDSKKGTGDPSTVNLSKSYLENETLLLREEARRIKEFCTGFILIDNEVTSIVANVKNNPDRPEIRKKGGTSTKMALTSIPTMGEQAYLNQQSLIERPLVGLSTDAAIHKISMGKPLSFVQSSKLETSVGLNSNQATIIRDLANFSVKYNNVEQYSQLLAWYFVASGLPPI